MDKNRENNKIKLIKSKYYNKIKNIFDKSLGFDGDVLDKITDIEKCIKECDKEIYNFKMGQVKKIHVQTFENFTKFD